MSLHTLIIKQSSENIKPYPHLIHNHMNYCFKFDLKKRKECLSWLYTGLISKSESRLNLYPLEQQICIYLISFG